MAPLNPPTWLQAGSYSALLDRLALGALMTPAPTVGALAVRSGVKPGGMTVTQRATPGMAVTVGAGTAFVQSPQAAGGVYVVHNDAPYDVTIATAHASLGRRDLIVVRIYDAEITGSTNAWALEAVTGTPAGSPSPPAVPSGAMAIAQIQVNASASSITNANITDLRTYTAALGGAVPVPAASLPASPYVGQAVYDSTNLLPKWWSGSAWRNWRDEGYQTAANVTSILGTYGPAYAHDQGGTRTVSTTGAFVNFTSAPSVTVTVPASGRVLVSWGFSGYNSNSEQSTIRMSVDLSGANSQAASTGNSCSVAGPAVAASSTPSQAVSRTKLYTGLSAGSTTFKVQARLSSGDSTTHQINDSWLYVQPIW